MSEYGITEPRQLVFEQYMSRYNEALNSDLAEADLKRVALEAFAAYIGICALVPESERPAVRLHTPLERLSDEDRIRGVSYALAHIKRPPTEQHRPIIDHLADGTLLFATH
jgi:hypothetical protein